MEKHTEPQLTDLSRTESFDFSGDPMMRSIAADGIMHKIDLVATSLIQKGDITLMLNEEADETPQDCARRLLIQYLALDRRSRVYCTILLAEALTEGLTVDDPLGSILNSPAFHALMEEKESNRETELAKKQELLNEKRQKQNG